MNKTDKLPELKPVKPKKLEGLLPKKEDNSQIKKLNLTFSNFN